MNKHKRTNEVTDMDDSFIMDTLNKIPLLYRSIQAITYIKNNLPIITKENCLSETNDYYRKIIKMFFSGCNMWYLEEECNLTNNKLNIYILSNYSENKLLLQMSLFIDFFEKTIIKCYIDSNISFFWFSLMIQESCISFEISLCEYDHHYNQLLRYYEIYKSEEEQEKQENDNTIDYI